VRGHIFADAFLWFNPESSSFNDAFRVEMVGAEFVGFIPQSLVLRSVGQLAMYLPLFM